MLPRRVWRNDSLATAFIQPVAQPPGIIGTVCQEFLRRRDASQKLGNAGQIVGLAGRQAQRDGPSDLIGQGVNLGRPSAARASDGLGELPLFRRWPSGVP